MNARSASLLIPLAAGSLLLAGCRPPPIRSSTRASTASASHTGSVSAAAGGVERIRAETRAGDIRFEPQEGDVTVTYTITAAGPRGERLAEWARATRVDATREGSALVVKPVLPEGLPRDVSISAALEIRGPASAALDLETGSGSIRARGAGSATAKAGVGDIRLTEIRGAAKADSGAGAIHLEGIGGAATAKTGTGDIEIARVAGAVRADAGSGSIRAAEVRGPLAAGTGIGDITLQGLEGGATVRSSSGGIDAGAIRSAASQVRLQTGIGEVRFAGAAGELHMETNSGGLHARLDSVPRDTRLKCGIGDVEVVLPPNAGAEIEAGTGIGEIDTASLQAVRAEPGGSAGPSREWRGRIGNGGPRISLRTNTGSVRLSHKQP